MPRWCGGLLCNLAANLLNPGHIKILPVMNDYLWIAREIGLRGAGATASNRVQALNMV